jgi:hypothetical protein
MFHDLSTVWTLDDLRDQLGYVTVATVQRLAPTAVQFTAADGTTYWLTAELVPWLQKEDE